MTRSHFMLGMRLDDLDGPSGAQAIMDCARSGRRGYACISNVHMCVLAHDDRAFRSAVNGATLVLPDSTILQRARSVRYGVPFRAPTRGAELMMNLAGYAAQEGVPVALIGGSSDAALGTLEEVLRTQFPSLDIAYSYSPPFRTLSAEEDAEMTSSIRASGARLVFVGLGCPKQENWMAQHTERLEAMLVGVGAAFDFNAGIVQKSPEWVHRSGLEWLYRLVLEPRRLWKRYLSTSPRFLGLLLVDAIGLGRAQ